MCHRGKRLNCAMLIWRLGSQCDLPGGVAVRNKWADTMKHLELALTHGVYSVHASPVIYLSVLLLCLESALLPFCCLSLGNHVASVSSSTARRARTPRTSQVLALLGWWVWHSALPSGFMTATVSTEELSSVQFNPIQFNSSILFSASHSFHLFTNISWGPRHA